MSVCRWRGLVVPCRKNVKEVSIFVWAQLHLLVSSACIVLKAYCRTGKLAFGLQWSIFTDVNHHVLMYFEKDESLKILYYFTIAKFHDFISPT